MLGDKRDIPPLPNVAGHSLDGRIYTISSEQNRLLCESLGVEPDCTGRAHPSFLYIATQVGMGETVAGLCKLCHHEVSNGLMLGSCDLRFADPLMTDVDYTVRGNIVGITRKTSRKLGIMDVLEYTLHLDRADGVRAGTITNTWILARGRADEV